jgi:hypothetical protein
MTNRAGDKETAQFMGALMEPTDDHAAAVQMAGLLAKKVQQNVSNSATVTAEAHLDGGGHVTFLPVPEDQRARRAKERERWREPLYKLPVGVVSFLLICRPPAGLRRM